MERPITHTVLNPDNLAPPRGFSHVVIPAAGKLGVLGGQIASRADGSIEGDTMTEQFDIAAANVVSALDAVGANPYHLVSMHIFVTDLMAYRASLGQIGQAYREHFGDHYPAISLFEVKGLFDSEAMVELVAIAVLPD